MSAPEIVDIEPRLEFPDAVPVDRLVASLPPAPAPAERLHDLDFLLGDFRVRYVNLTTPRPTTGEARWDTRVVNGGHHYEMTQTISVPGITAKWIFGWDQLADEFVSFYYDDWGNYSTATSPGWQDGHLRFSGECLAFGGRYRFQEDLQVVGENHYRKIGFLWLDGKCVQGDLINCHRI